jgi:hypothetical protein
MGFGIIEKKTFIAWILQEDQASLVLMPTQVAIHCGVDIALERLHDGGNDDLVTWFVVINVALEFTIKTNS